MKKLLFAFLLLPFFVQAQLINTVAGNGSLIYSGDSAAATAASFYYPAGVAADAAGNIYISDAFNSVVRKVNSAGIITTIAGNGTAGFSGDGGRADTAALNAPGALSVDAMGNLYIADVGNARIREVNTFGNISTVAGGGSSYAEGILDTSYSLAGPSGIAFDVPGNMYISDDGRIHEISIYHTITTIAGFGAAGFDGDGGPASAAVFDSPQGLAVDAAGNIYIADMNNFRIRKVNISGIVSTIAGNGDGTGTGYGAYSGDNGPANEAALNFPTGVAIGPGGIFIADRNNNRVRMINGAGNMVTVAGDGTAGFGGDGGPAVNAQLSAPGSIAIDATGNLYIADELNNRIRKVSGIKVPAGVNNIQATEKIEVYPNPSDDHFTVTGLAPSDRICLYDLPGRMVCTKMAANSEEQLNIDKLIAGAYFLQVWDKNGRIKTRLTVVKD